MGTESDHQIIMFTKLRNAGAEAFDHLRAITWIPFRSYWIPDVEADVRTGDYHVSITLSMTSFRVEIPHSIWAFPVILLNEVTNIWLSSVEVFAPSIEFIFPRSILTK